MHGLRTNEQLNAEAVIKGVLRRAADRGVMAKRSAVLEALRFTEDEDVTQWEATVDALMANEYPETERVAA